jgi:hypothetical protein
MNHSGEESTAKMIETEQALPRPLAMYIGSGVVVTSPKYSVTIVWQKSCGHKR